MQRKVIISEYKLVTNEHGDAVRDFDGKVKYELEETGVGVFGGYGVDYEEFDNGVGNYSTAIVEMEDGTVKNIPVGQVKFID